MSRLHDYTTTALGAAAILCGVSSPGLAADDAPRSVDEQIAAYQTLADNISHADIEYAQYESLIGKPQEITVLAADSGSDMDALLGSINTNISHFDAVHELFSVYGAQHHRLITADESLKSLAPELDRLEAARLADADQAHSLWQEILSYAQEAQALGDDSPERRETLFGRMNDDNRASRKLEADMDTVTAQIAGLMGRASDTLRGLIQAGNSLPLSAGAPELPDVDGITFQKGLVTAGRGILKSTTGVMDLAAIAPGTHVDGVAELETGAIYGAVLHLSDRTQIVLANATTAQLDYFESAASGRLKSGTITVIKGTFGWTAGHTSGIAPELTLIVPAGQIRFRGREFAVTVNADGSGSIDLRDGDMEITEKKPPESTSKRGHNPKSGTLHLTTSNRILFRADGTWGPPTPLGL